MSVLPSEVSVRRAASSVTCAPDVADKPPETRSACAPWRQAGSISYHRGDMSPMARKLLEELQRHADALGYVDGSQKDYKGRVNAPDIHCALIELKDNGYVNWGNTHITPADDAFRAKLTGLWPLHQKLLQHLNAVGGPGEFQVVYNDLAQQLGCTPGDAQEALLNLRDEGEIRVFSHGDRAVVQLLGEAFE